MFWQKKGVLLRQTKFSLKLAYFFFQNQKRQNVIELCVKGKGIGLFDNISCPISGGVCVKVSLCTDCHGLKDVTYINWNSPVSVAVKLIKNVLKQMKVKLKTLLFKARLHMLLGYTSIFKSYFACFTKYKKIFLKCILIFQMHA